MAVLAWILGLLAGLCLATGIVISLDLCPLLAAIAAPLLWLLLAADLLLCAIASAIASRRR